jgi:hypothetical protein
MGRAGSGLCAGGRRWAARRRQGSPPRRLTGEAGPGNVVAWVPGGPGPQFELPIPFQGFWDKFKDTILTGGNEDARVGAWRDRLDWDDSIKPSPLDGKQLRGAVGGNRQLERAFIDNAHILGRGLRGPVLRYR